MYRDIYRYIYIYVKESKRMHQFSVTLSFAPRHLSDRQKVLYIHSALLLQH